MASTASSPSTFMPALSSGEMLANPNPVEHPTTASSNSPANFNLDPDFHHKKPLPSQNLSTKFVPDLTITLSAPPNAGHQRTKSPIFSNTTPSSSKFFDTKALGATPIKTTEAFDSLSKEIKHDKYTDVVIVDLRPFNAYNTSRVINALNICVPSTLLKRPSFTISNISKTMIASQQEELDSKLESPNDLRLIFYDANSKEDHCSFQLYQIIKKFKDTLPVYEKKIEMFFVNNGIDLFKKDKLTSTKFLDYKPFKASNSPETCTFSDFVLPSADPSSSFLMSVKKNQYCISPEVSKDIKLQIPDFNDKEKLPPWLKKYTKTESVQKIISNFVKIENSENQRISNSVQRRLSAASNKLSPNSVGGGSPVCISSPSGSYLFNGSEKGFKNRYPNILPYEHSRVKLVPSPMGSASTSSALNHQGFFFSPEDSSGVESSPTASCLLQRSSSVKSNKSVQGSRKANGSDDYFNANFISVPQINEKSHYIATQAPLTSTIDDFWKVVWQNGTEVVVSLTNLNENGVKKSDIYWNDSKQVKLLEETNEFDGIKDLIVRKIQLSRHGKKRIVYQLNYTNWPDHGVVQSHNDLLKLVYVKQKLNKNKDSPILVHCSAGCGRTGTFITIDLIIQAFKDKKAEEKNPVVLLDEDNPDDGSRIGDVFNTETDLIYFTVQQLRKQRISMVQSLDQFILCYETIMYYFKALDNGV